MPGLLEDDKEFLSRSEVAEIFRVSPNTVTRWAEAGELPYVRTLGGHRRYDKEAVEKLARKLSKRSQEDNGVKTTTLNLPRMYGDHHVTAVREVLAKLDGIDEVHASAAFKEATVTYDPETISDEEIAAQLADAGYPPGEDDQPKTLGKREKDPAWEVVDIRITQTNPVDIEMSGEFRRY